MCGIVGFTGHRMDEETLLRAVGSLRHRGPDGAGIYIAEDAPVGLGHARLSIIDLAAGRQPLFSEERDVVLVCNGEIYDFERIRSNLEGNGHRFNTHSDSEVIIHAYQEYGLRLVELLRGEFAFLLYDSRAEILLAVRDRFGIKPLFFSERNGAYLFASEAKALFATGLLVPAIDAFAIRDYLSGVIPDSIFKHVDVVPPGCMLKVDLTRGGHTVTRYWDLDLPAEDSAQEHGTLQDHMHTVKDGVEEAVRLRMRADVPVGVTLSGGIDSAIVAAAASKSCSGKLRAFTVAFPGSAQFDELPLAENMAQKVGAELYSISCDERTLLANMEGCLWVSELPFPNFHGVGKFLLSRLAQEHVKVVLTGEGSDETFLGYTYFQPNKGWASDYISGRGPRRGLFSARRSRAIEDALGFVPLPEHAVTLSPWRQRQIRGLFAAPLRSGLKASPPLDRLKERMDRHQTDGRPLTRQIQYFSIRLMLAPYLLTILGDRAEMAHSVEGRTPFLDHLLFERVRAIPDHFKIRDGVEKYILREAFKEELTPELYARKKWPYLAPPLWISTGHGPEMDRLLERYLCKEAIEKGGIFDYGAIRRIYALQRAIWFDCGMKRILNVLLTVCLTVQILDELYVQNFDHNLQLRMAVPSKAVI